MLPRLIPAKRLPSLLGTTVLAIAVLAVALEAPPIASAQVGIPGGQIGRDTVPSLAYFRAIERLYEGNYRDAERTFRREIRGAVKIGIAGRWLDSIAYHALLGEVFYHQGRLPEALEQFDQACLMLLQNPNWMIQVDFKRDPVPDTNRLRTPLPWGQSSRQFTLGRFPSQELIRIGSMQEANRAAVQGGALQSPQLWQLDVIEIQRATALAIRRRNELLGPLGAEDTISRELVTTLSRGTTIPNHWSKAWADLQLGLAQAGVGKPDQAEKYLQQALLIGGQYDHPLSCVAMLELGRIKMEAGDGAAAATLLSEASYSAFYYEDLGIIDDAFRLGTMNRLAGGPQTVNPALELAVNWTSRKRYFHISSRINLALCEELLHLGNDKLAQTALGNATSRMRDASRGLLGNYAQYLDARLQFQSDRDSAPAALSDAVARHINMSVHNLQLMLANRRYDQQQLRARTAVGIYQTLLGDPQPVDWMLRPFETLARLKTSHTAAFDRWLDAVLARKDMGAALEITDLAKRDRYHNALAWGGRLAALRDTLETPEHLLNQHSRNQRNELLLRYPQYNEISKAGEQLQSEISQQWQPGIDEEQERDLARLWRAWDMNLDQREAMLGKIGLQRAAVDMQFPPVLATTNLQKQLQPGQAIAVFHDTPAATLGFLLTSNASTSWQCAPKKRIGSLLATFLRDLGNYDANHKVPIAELQSDEWKESGSLLYRALFEGSSLDPSQLDELIVVPDGLVWYVPFTALPIKTLTAETESSLVPLIAESHVRIAPTVGLAFGNVQPWRRVRRTGIVGQDVLPGESDDDKLESLESLRKDLENPIAFPTSAPAPTPILGSLTDTLIVLNDVELDLAGPLEWSPIAQSRGAKQSSLSHWLALPQFGPQRIVLPAARTVAERGGKISKRKGGAKAPAGTEMFLASCGLMSTGAQTILLSSWRVGGDATYELMREFLQEVPYTTAAAAWQRSVQSARELSLIPNQQPRVKVSTKDDGVELTAAHPFFWAGYQLIDAGAAGAAEEEPEAEAQPVAGLKP